ncbi:hypothetical protein BGW41_003737 [Actinomortierella wolfii]|nr:hypothetical protein BGW41_003737 [Actinomortierella wolfii]
MQGYSVDQGIGSHGATIDQRPNTEHENGDNRTNNDRNSYNRISSYNNSVYHEVAGNDDNLSATSTQLAPLMSASEQYEYETRHLSQQIFNISSNIAVLERLIPCLGQRHKDTVEMRESLHSVLDQTRELVKSANTQVKHLARFHLPQALQSHPGGDGSGNGSAGSSSNGDGALSFTPQRQRTYGSIGEDLQPLVQHVSPSRPTANNRRNDHIAMDMVERGLLRRPVIQYSDLTPAQRQVVTNRRLTHQRLTKDLTVVTKAFQDLQRRAIEAERQQVAQLRRLSSSCASLRQQSAESMEEANNSDAQDMYEGDGVEGVPIMKLDLDLKVVPLMNRPEDTTTGVLPRLDSSKARTPHGDMAGKLPHQPGPPQTAAFPRRPRHPQQLPEDPSSNQKEQRRHPQQQHTHPHDRQLSVQEQAHLAELRWMDSELELQEAILQEREEEILKIEHGMTQVLQVMQELGAMVHEQRAGVDMLQDSISQTRSHIDCAHQEIVQASDYERKSRERLCYLLMIISLVVFVVLLAITS